MTDTKNPLPEIFTYGKDDTSADKSSEPTEDKSKAAPVIEKDTKKSSSLFLSLIFFFGVIITAVILYYGLIPDGVMKTLADSAISYAENFHLENLIYSAVFSAAAKLSLIDLSFFALLFISPYVLFSKTFVGALVLLRTTIASLACGIALCYSGASASVLIVTVNAFSALFYLLGAHFAVKYSEKLRDKTKRLTEKFKESFKYLISVLSLLGGAVITKTILIIIANTIIK